MTLANFKLNNLSNRYFHLLSAPFYNDPTTSPGDTRRNLIGPSPFAPIYFPSVATLISIGIDLLRLSFYLPHPFLVPVPAETV